jgi:hypothetical protein
MRNIMAEKKDSSKSKQIKILLAVLGTGGITGILISLTMLYYYNPNGSYPVDNVLLNPENAYSLRYVEPSSKVKSEGRFVFEKMNYSYFDPNTKQTVSISIPKDKYAEFYKIISHDKSVSEPLSEIESLFRSTNPSSLALKVRPIGEDATKGNETTFSRIVFADNGDYYRIQLRQSTSVVDWAYFHHPKISQIASQLFNSHD